MQTKQFELNKSNKSLVKSLEKKLLGKAIFRFESTQDHNLWIKVKGITERFSYYDENGIRKKEPDFVHEVLDAIAKTPINHSVDADQDLLNRLLQCCVRNFRTQIIILHKKETEIRNANLDERIINTKISQFRDQIIEDAIKKARAKRPLNEPKVANAKVSNYFTNQKKNALMSMAREYLSFMLFDDELPMKKALDQADGVNSKPVTAMEKVCHSSAKTLATKNVKPVTQSTATTRAEIPPLPVMPPIVAPDPASLDINNLEHALMAYSRSELLQLQADIANVLLSRQQQALAQIAEMIHSHDLTIEQVAEYQNK